MKQYNKSTRSKIFNYLENSLSLKKSTKGWYRSDCPYCGGVFCFGVNLQLSKCHCFKCGERQTPIEVIMFLNGFKERRQAYDVISSESEYSKYEDYSASKKEVEYKKIELPEGFQLIGNATSLLGKSAQRYINKKRKIPMRRLQAASVGYCLEGPYKGYIIFPIYRRGELIFFQGRRFIDIGPKMKNPPEEEIGIGKSFIFYNEDALYMYRTIYLVESITNCLTLGERAVGALGKKLSPNQLNKLIKAPFENLVIILDPDALTEAFKLALMLCNYKRCKLLILPNGKDVNDVGAKFIKKLEKITPYKKYMEFFKQRLEHEKITLPAYNRGPINRVPTRGF